MWYRWSGLCSLGGARVAEVVVVEFILPNKKDILVRILQVLLLYLLFVLMQGMIIKSGYALKQVLPNMHW